MRSELIKLTSWVRMIMKTFMKSTDDEYWHATFNQVFHACDPESNPRLANIINGKVLDERQ
jgi:hypothetical protein